MKRLWILEEQGDAPYPIINLPLDWELTINFATEFTDLTRVRVFKVRHIIDDSNSIPQASEPEQVAFDEWNW
jgi:hypothetical protein